MNRDPLKFNTPGNWARPSQAKFNATKLHSEYAQRPPFEPQARRLGQSPKLKKIKGAPLMDMEQLKHKCLALLDATDTKSVIDSSMTDLESKLFKATAKDVESQQRNYKRNLLKTLWRERKNKRESPGAWRELSENERAEALKIEREYYTEIGGSVKNGKMMLKLAAQKRNPQQSTTAERERRQKHKENIRQRRQQRVEREEAEAMAKRDLELEARKQAREKALRAAHVQSQVQKKRVDTLAAGEPLTYEKKKAEQNEKLEEVRVAKEAALDAQEAAAEEARRAKELRQQQLNASEIKARQAAVDAASKKALQRAKTCPLESPKASTVKKGQSKAEIERLRKELEEAEKRLRLEELQEEAKRRLVEEAREVTKEAKKAGKKATKLSQTSTASSPRRKHGRSKPPSPTRARVVQAKQMAQASATAPLETRTQTPAAAAAAAAAGEDDATATAKTNPAEPQTEMWELGAKGERRMANELIGVRVEVFWEGEGKWFAGKVRNTVGNDEIQITYDDGDEGVATFGQDKVKLLQVLPKDGAKDEAAAAAEENAKREAEENARIVAEVSARMHVEEKAKREAEENAKKETEEKAQLETEVRARIEAEMKAKREAEKKAKIEAEEKARMEAEEKSKQEAEEQAKRESAEKAKKEADEKAKKEAEEKAKKEAEEKAKREAEEKAKREAEEKAKREAEEKAKLEAEEKAKLEAEKKAEKEAEQNKTRHASNAATEFECPECCSMNPIGAKECAECDYEFEAGDSKVQVEVEAKARKEGEEQAKREREEKIKREAEEKAKKAEEKVKREAEEKANEAEAKVKREAEEKAKKAEEKVKREAEEKANEAEDKAKRKAEEKVKKEAEKKAEREAEKRAEREAEKKAEREAEEKAKKEAEKKAKREAEKRAEREAEKKAEREAEEKAKKEAEKKAKREAEKRVEREAERKAKREAEEKAKKEAEEKVKKEAEEKAKKEAEKALFGTSTQQRRKAEAKAKAEAEAAATAVASGAPLIVGFNDRDLDTQAGFLCPGLGDQFKPNHVFNFVYADPPHANTPLANASDMRGNVALIDRGVCVYGDKVKHAESAGAIAVIICNNDEADPESIAEFNAEGQLPFVMVSYSAGMQMKSSHDARGVFKEAGAVWPAELAAISEKAAKAARKKAKREAKEKAKREVEAKAKAEAEAAATAVASGAPLIVGFNDRDLDTQAGFLCPGLGDQFKPNHVFNFVYADPPHANTPLANASDMRGNVALIDRGVCVYGDKVKHAESAGAIAVIICNNDEADPESIAEFNAEGQLPFVMVSYSAGMQMKSSHDARGVFKEAGAVWPVGFFDIQGLDEDDAHGAASSPVNLVVGFGDTDLDTQAGFLCPGLGDQFKPNHVFNFVYADPPHANTPLANASDMRGNVALIDRGVCVYGDKVKHAESAGAIAVIICNNDEADPECIAEFNAEGQLPFVMVSYSAGMQMKASDIQRGIFREPLRTGSALKVNYRKKDFMTQAGYFCPQLHQVFASEHKFKYVYSDPPYADGPLKNAKQARGNVLLVDRGVVVYDEKVKNAEEAGAVAVIVANNDDANPDDTSEFNARANIPFVMISFNDAQKLKQSTKCRAKFK